VNRSPSLPDSTAGERAGALYLGLDVSTQSLSGVVLRIEDRERRVVYRRSLIFDEEFPRYHTRNGVLPHDDPRIATSSPLLWSEALDRFFEIMAAESDLDLARLRAVSGAAQQHGSVYCNREATARLAALDPTRPLAHQIRAMLSRADAPTWMDSSTATECAAISDAIGGPEALIRLTGSRACERFTGPQIRKYARVEPDGYASTDRIHLVSSFLASVLVGAHAPIEPGDGAGMNLMDIVNRQWAETALRATAPGLRAKLPDLAPSWSVMGRLAPYWTERHGLPAANVIAWTGDNPSSLIGTGLVASDRIAISLGTSDTVFGLMRDARVDLSGASHVFGAPTGDYMALVCFKNGALARERVRDAYDMDWREFSRALRETPPGNRGAIMLPWFEPEITPPVASAGVRRYGLDPADAPANVRALIEAQMLGTARHAGWMGERVRGIHATGGGARNREILQIMADVHDADVYRLEVSDSAALGAALRAFHGDELARGTAIEWTDVVAGFADPVVDSVVRPDPGNVAIYARLRAVHAACEAHALGRGEDPMPLIGQFGGERTP